MVRKRFCSALCGCSLLLTGCSVQASECGAGGSAGGGVGQSTVRDAPLNPDKSFTKDQAQTVLHSQLVADCAGADLKFHLNAYGERIESFESAGIAQDKNGSEDRGFIREAYVSLNPSESWFIDVGKKDIRNGQFFFISPLDFLQNPGNYSSRGISNELGVSWRDTYREGSVAAQASWFSQYGTLELAAIPQLANDSHKTRVADWTTLQRTNSLERYYAAYTTSQFEDFNPRFVLVVGDDVGMGLGTSGFLTDDVTLNLELAASDKSYVREVSPEALRKFQLGSLPSADEVFVEQQRNAFYQFGAGLRYSTENNLAVSLEYLSQNQGLNSQARDNYFDFIDLSEQAFQASGLDLFRGYQLLFVQETDNRVRRDLLLGRQYLMAHVQRAKPELRTLSWETATTYNMEDRSYAVNVHLSSALTHNVEVYVGGGYLGGPDKSEFGQLGTSGVGYAGVRAIW